MSAIGLLPDGMTLGLQRTWDPGGCFTNDPLSCFDKNNSCDGGVMKGSLPPLNGLRAFEAAARHMSFTDAADELSVTQAAISHQVRGLEQRLGLKLFVRRNRSLLLSEAGQAYLPAVRGAFDQLNEATEKLLQKDRGGHLTGTTQASFAMKWVVPRLGGLQRPQPPIGRR